MDASLPQTSAAPATSAPSGGPTRISVAMATCDGAAWIEIQLRSILGQLGLDDEVVVADASSRDTTLERIEAFADPRIRILRDLPRGDIPGTFEAALRDTRGEFVFLSDQDDQWLPTKVERCLAGLQGTSSSLLLHDARVVDGHGATLAPSFLEARGFRPGFWPNLAKPGYLGCALVFRRRLLEVALPFPKDVPMHDWWLGLLAERNGGVAVLREPLILHVRHGANANFAPGRSPFPLLERLRFRLLLWRALKSRP